MPHNLAAPPARALAVLIAWTFAGGVAAAQPPDAPQAPDVTILERLMSAEVRTVFGASRYLERVIDAPASISIVTAEEIERFGYATLADVLRGVRGLHVTSDRNYTYLGVRGAARPGDYNTRVLLLVDGHRLNDNIYDHATIGAEFPVDVELIERIEIVRGPLSTMYGTNALFGVVNVVTRRRRALPAFSGSAEAGSFNTWRARGSVAGGLRGGGDYLASASGFISDGRRDLEFPRLQPGLGVVRVHPELDAEEYGQLFGTLRSGGWTAQGLFGARRKGIPTGAFGTRLDDPRTETRDVRAYLDLQYAADWRGTSVRARGAYDLYRYDGRYVYPDGDGSLVEQDGSRGQWWSTELSGVRRLGGAHLVTAGLELRGNLQQDQIASDDAGAVSVDDRRDSFVWSLFAQDEVTIRPGLLLNASAGLDRFPTFGAHATYRGALIVKPATDRSVKLIYGTAFRAPNAYELYYYRRPEGQPELEPERVSTLELAWESYFGPGLRISGSAFRNRLDDQVSQIADEEAPSGLYFRNEGHLRATGAGIEAEGVLAGTVHAFAAYTFANARETSGAAGLNAPRHTIAARVTAPLGTVAFVGVEARRLSKRAVVDGDWVPGVTIARLSLNSARIGPGLRLRLTLDNVFDAVYADPGAQEHPDPRIPQDGRTARLRVTWDF